MEKVAEINIYIYTYIYIKANNFDLAIRSNWILDVVV